MAARSEPPDEVFTKEEMMEETAKLVVVAWVEVELMAVKFWRVEDEFTKRLPKVPRPVMEAELTVRRPLALMERAAVEEVAKVEGEEVAK